MMIRALRALTVLSLLAALAACGGGDENAGGDGAAALDPDGLAASNGDPVRGDWMVRWLGADPENLNPLTSNDQPSSQVGAYLFPGMLARDNETFALRPLIARDLPYVSEDKLTYAFRLRDDVTFSDGTPVTAHDIVFAMKATKNPRVRAPQLRNYYQHVRAAIADDEHTVRFEMHQPYFKNDSFLGGVAPLPRHHYDPEGLMADISVAELDEFEAMPAAKQERAAEFAKRFNSDFNRDPLGAGAYYIQDLASDIRTGERIVLHHRDDYWAPDDPAMGDGWVDRVVFRIINDREAALVALKAGDLDLLELSPLQYVKATDGKRFKERARKHVYTGGNYSYIAWNQRHPALEDRRVRSALGHFVDKQGIVDRILFGLGTPVESPIYVERPEYNHDLPPHVYDPEKGKALLAEAGWRDQDGDGVLDRRLADGTLVPLRFEIISNAGNDKRKAVGLTVIDELKRVGIDASFRQIDWSILLDRVRKGEFDALILGWGSNITEPDPYQIWHSSQRGGGSNYIDFSSAEVDRILEENRLEFDPARRIELMRRFQEIIHEEQPYTFLYSEKELLAWSRRFHGVRWYPSGGTDLYEWYVPLELQRYSN